MCMYIASEKRVVPITPPFVRSNVYCMLLILYVMYYANSDTFPVLTCMRKFHLDENTST